MAETEIETAVAEEERLLREIIARLVDNPDEVHIESMVSARSVVFDIFVAEGDVGMVLGRRGVYADSLRIIFSALYGKLGKKVHLQVVGPRRS